MDRTGCGGDGCADVQKSKIPPSVCVLRGFKGPVRSYKCSDSIS